MGNAFLLPLYRSTHYRFTALPLYRFTALPLYRSTYYLLPITYYLLPTTYYRFTALPITALPITHYPLPKNIYMPDYLNFTPSWGMTVTKKCPVSTIKFGDGYAQRSAFNSTKEIEAAFRGLPFNQAYELTSNFELWAGIESFYWRAFDARDWELFFVEQWTSERVGEDAVNVSATFMQKIELAYSHVQLPILPMLELIPSNSSSATRNYAVRKAQFKEGYIERGVDGINSAVTTFAVKVNGMDISAGLMLDEFLDERRGCVPFYWSEYGGSSTNMFTCSEWSFDFISSTLVNFSGTFIQTFL